LFARGAGKRYFLTCFAYAFIHRAAVSFSNDEFLKFSTHRFFRAGTGIHVACAVVRWNTFIDVLLLDNVTWWTLWHSDSWAVVVSFADFVVAYAIVLRAAWVSGGTTLWSSAWSTCWYSFLVSSWTGHLIADDFVASSA